MAANRPQTSGTIEPYTSDQVMVTLALLTYLHQARTGSESEVAQVVLRALEEALQTQPVVAGDWTVVWGPALSKLRTDEIFYNNLMFVVKSTRHDDRYAVVIRGTPFLSASTWIFEDLGVARMVPWPYGDSPEDAKIAHGTWLGLEALADMQAPDGVPGAGTSLVEFLASVLQQAKSDVVSLEVTGHSLGGTLCTPLALFLEDSRAGDTPWDPADKAAIQCTSFAGLSPGNRAFATYAEAQMGDRTRRVVNSKDLAPLAWNEQTMATAPGLYLPNIEMPEWLQIAWEGLETVVKGHDYLQTSPEIRLTGAVNMGYNTYLTQFAFQHLCAYPILLGVPEVLASLPMFPCQVPASLS